MKLRTTKKECKKLIRDFGLEVIAVHNRTFVVKPKPNFLCARMYAYIVVAENHIHLDALIKEGEMSIQAWENFNLLLGQEHLKRFREFKSI